MKIHKATKTILEQIKKEMNQPLTELSKKLNISYSHLHGEIILLEKHGLINTKKRGRRRHAIITQKGKKILELIEETEQMLQ